MKKNLPYILLAVLVICQLLSLSKINQLEEHILRMDGAMNSMEDRILNRIYSIYDNVDDKLEEAYGLIYKAEKSYGTIDTENLTIPVSFTVEPRTVTDSLKVSLKFGEEILPLEKNGTSYTGTKDFALANEAVCPTIILEDKGVQSVAEESSLYVEDVLISSCPLFSVSWRRGADTTNKDGSYTYEPCLDVSMDMLKEAESYNIAKGSLVTKVEGEVVEEIPLALPSAEPGYYAIYQNLDRDVDYILQEGEVFTSAVVLEDNLGFVYEYPMEHYLAGAGAQREPSYQWVNIYAPDGAYIYSGEY